MQFTQYFLHTRNRSDRSMITDEWIQQAIDSPIHTEVQADGRIRKWTKIEKEDRFLRIILLEDGKTVHNAFLDRNFKETK